MTPRVRTTRVTGLAPSRGERAEPGPRLVAGIGRSLVFTVRTSRRAARERVRVGCAGRVEPPRRADVESDLAMGVRRPPSPGGAAIPARTPENQGVRWAVIGPLLALVVVGIVAAVTLVGRNNDHGSKSATSSGVAPSTGQVISTHNGTVSLTLPAGWRGADISTGERASAPSSCPTTRVPQPCSSNG